MITFFASLNRYGLSSSYRIEADFFVRTNRCSHFAVRRNHLLSQIETDSLRSECARFSARNILNVQPPCMALLGTAEYDPLPVGHPSRSDVVQDAVVG